MFPLCAIASHLHSLCVFGPSHTIRASDPIQNQRSTVAPVFFRLQRVHLPILATVLESQCTGQKTPSGIHSTIIESLLLGAETGTRRNRDKRLLGGGWWEGKAVKGNIGEAIFNSSNQLF